VRPALGNALAMTARTLEGVRFLSLEEGKEAE